MLGRVRPVLQRAGWGVADQALSSLTNFALGIFVARSVSATEFGAFALVFAAYVLSLGFSRAIVSEPLVVRFSGSAAAEWRIAVRIASGTSIALGVAVGVLLAVIGLFAGGAPAGGFIVLGVLLPGLLLQDCWRFAFFSAQRGASAFLNDLVWAIALVIAIPVLVITGRITVINMVAAWGLAANVAAVFGCMQVRTLPTPGAALQWLRNHRDLIPRFAGEVAAHTGTWQLIVYGIGAIAGLAALGAFRAGEILFGPLQVLAIGITLIAIPELVRMRRSAPGSGMLLVTRGAMTVAAICMAGAFACGAAILLIPQSIGLAVLGSMWVPARELAPALAIMWAGTGATLGAVVGLRALAAARRSLRARLVGSGLTMAGGVMGAYLGAAGGAAWGLAIGVWLGAAVWWWQFLVELQGGHESAALPEVEGVATGPGG